MRKDRETFSAEASAILNRAEAAIQAERLASTQAAELQRLVNQLEGQFEEMSRQRDDALTRVSEANASRQAADLRLQELQEDSRSERESLAQHVRAIEDRAHSEIDRARQESKELQGRVIAIAKERAAIEKSLLIAVEQAKVTATEASRQASIERARAEALEKQLAKLSDLPAALEEAMRRGSGDPPKEWKIGAKKTVRGSRSRAKVSTEKP